MIAYLPYSDNDIDSHDDHQGNLGKYDDVDEIDGKDVYESTDDSADINANNSVKNMNVNRGVPLNAFLSAIRQSEMGIFRTIASFL